MTPILLLLELSEQHPQSVESGELVYCNSGYSSIMYNFEIPVSTFEQCQASWSDKFDLKEDAMFCAGKVAAFLCVYKGCGWYGTIV